MTGAALLLCVSAAGCGDESLPDSTQGDSARDSVFVSRPADLAFAIPGDEFALPLMEVTDIEPVNDSVVIVSDREIAYSVNAVFGHVTGVIGRAGDGPGEFRRVSWIQAASPDTLAIYDRALRRVTVLNSLLEFDHVRNIVAPATSEDFRPECVLADGAVVGRAVEDWRGNPGGRNEGLFQPTIAVQVAGDDSIVNLGQLDDHARWVIIQTSGYRRTVLVIGVPFAPAPIIRCRGMSVYWSDAAQPILHVAERSGNSTSIHLTAWSAHNVSPADYAHFADSVEKAGGREARHLAETVAESAPRTKMPALRDFLIGTDSTIWALNYVTNERDDMQWARYSAEGSFLQIVTLPLRFSVKAASSHYLWGVWTADDGVQEVRAYRIPQPTSVS